MARVALAAGVLMAGGLYPILRHQPWTAFWERRAVLETLERHPKVKLLRMTAERGPRLRVEVQVHAEDVRKLIAFRTALRNHRLLSKYLVRSEVVWWAGGEVPSPSTVDCTFQVLPEQR